MIQGLQNPDMSQGRTRKSKEKAADQWRTACQEHQDISRWRGGRLGLNSQLDQRRHRNAGMRLTLSSDVTLTSPVHDALPDWTAAACRHVCARAAFSFLLITIHKNNNPSLMRGQKSEDLSQERREKERENLKNYCSSPKFYSFMDKI